MTTIKQHPILLLLCAVILVAATPSSAIADEMTLALSPALSCLTLPPGAPDRPEYPPETLTRKEGGLVKVQLEFRAPDKAPRVKLLSSSKIGTLDDAVTDHVEKYRVPCMQEANGPVTLVQQYDFDPDGRTRVVASATRDSADPDRAAQLRCIQHIVPNSIPEYPMLSRQGGEEGTLMAKLRFSAPDQAPTLEWMAPPPHRNLRISVQRYATGLRMPCLRNGPIEAMRAYRFELSGSAKIVLRDSSLIELLGAAKDLKTPAFFDFNRMSCPFDVRLTYHRPFSRNKVQQLDTLVAARVPLLEWLEELTLNFDQALSTKAFGNSTIVTVPCGKLDL